MHDFADVLSAEGEVVHYRAYQMRPVWTDDQQTFWNLPWFRIAAEESAGIGQPIILFASRNTVWVVASSSHQFQCCLAT